MQLYAWTNIPMWFFHYDFFYGGNVPSILIRVELEPFTLAVGLWMTQTGPYLLCTHQLTEVSHQLTLKVATLVQQDFLRQPKVDNELVP